MIVIVGNGMAGARLVTEIRDRDPHVPLTVFGAEPSRPYNRVLLSSVLAGKVDPAKIALLDPRWYAEHGVDARLGVEVTGIDRAARAVHAADGTTTSYDALVIATGGTAIVPPLPGVDAPGVASFRTLDDCRTILDLASGASRAVVVGGGLLGIEAARGLAGRGLDVTVAHLAGHLMERQLDPAGGRVLARTLAGLGIRTHVGADVAALRATASRVTGVELAFGEILPADLVVLACGVRPNVDLARAAGLTVDRGIVVDSSLRSIDDSAIHALGECSQHDGTVYGLVAPAWEQAAVLASVLTGGDARFTGARQITRLKAADVDLAAMGETHHTDEDPDLEVIRFADPARGTYKKVVIREDRLIGAILLGETTTAGTLTQLYDRTAPLPADRLSLLFPGRATAQADSPTLMPDTATVCHCNNVPKKRIVESWRSGARTPDQVSAETRAATGCGTCRQTLEGLLTWLNTQD